MSEKEEFAAQFRKVQPKFSRFYASVLARANLTLAQYALLAQLVNEGTMSMSEVGGKLYVSKPAVTNLVDRLEKNKFLKRIAHPKDRRIYLLEVQPRARKIIREVQAEIFNFLLQAFEQFNSAEQKTISRFYSLISQIMDERLTQEEEK